MELTAVLAPADAGGYIALTPETGTMIQGDTGRGKPRDTHQGRLRDSPKALLSRVGNGV
jgi:hypothetical protein